MNIDIGMTEKDRETVAESLKRLLRETYALYVKTHYFHWNIEGPMFVELHALFEKQYTEIWEAVDEIAERIRALGFLVPADFAELKAETATSKKDLEIVKILLLAHEKLIHIAREVFKLSEKTGDSFTADLVTQRLGEHEKHAWMLRTLLV